MRADVVETGLVLHPRQPWLCGSPDGLVLKEDGTHLLEIKCPFSRKDGKIIDYENFVTFVPYIKYRNGKLELVKGHKYYTQVQLLMYICGIEKCFFFVYSSKESITIPVKKDKSFLCAAVRYLEDFYFEWFLPALAKL